MKVSHLFPRLPDILRDACKAAIGPFTYDEDGCEKAIAAVVEAVRQSDAKDALLNELANETHNIHLKDKVRALLSK